MSLWRCFRQICISLRNPWVDEVQVLIAEVITNLAVASDILKKKIVTLDDKEKLYCRLREVPALLRGALEYFEMQGSWQRL